MRRHHAESSPRRRIRKGIRWGVGIFLVLLVLEYLVLPELGGARKSLNLIGRVNVAYLLLGVLLEAASLVAYAQLTRTVLPVNGPNRWRLLRINMSSLALSHIVPGGTAGGTALGYRLLTQNDVSGPDAGFALAMQGVGSALVLNAVFWLALVISLFFHGYNPLYSVAAGAGVLMMTVFAGVVVLLTRGRRRVVDVVKSLASRVPFLDGEKLAGAVQEVADRLRVFAGDRELLYRAASWAAGNWLLDAASLWVFIAAFHNYVSPINLLVSYGLANVLAVIPITPGGLGVVEGVLIPTLHGFHVPSKVALLGVLGYRLVNFWLPIPVGGGTYLSLRFASQGWRERIHAVRDEIVEHKEPSVETPGFDGESGGDKSALQGSEGPGPNGSSERTPVGTASGDGAPDSARSTRPPGRPSSSGSSGSGAPGRSSGSAGSGSSGSSGSAGSGSAGSTGSAGSGSAGSTGSAGSGSAGSTGTRGHTRRSGACAPANSPAAVPDSAVAAASNESDRPDPDGHGPGVLRKAIWSLWFGRSTA